MEETDIALLDMQAKEKELAVQTWLEIGSSLKDPGVSSRLGPGSSCVSLQSHIQPPS